MPKFWYENDKKGALLNQKRGSTKDKKGLYLNKSRVVQCTLVTVENWGFYQDDFEKGALLNQNKGFTSDKIGLYFDEKGAVIKECIYKNGIYNMSNSKELDTIKGAFKSNDNTSNNKTNSENNNQDKAAKEVIDYLNLKANKQFRHVESNIKYIRARLNEGTEKEKCTVEDLKAVIDLKVDEWLDNEKMNKYLRPTTLFAGENFEKYLNEVKEQQQKEQDEQIFEGIPQITEEEFLNI